MCVESFSHCGPKSLWSSDDGLQFNVLFNSISVIAMRWEGDNERLCAMEPRLRLKIFPPPAGLKLGTARLAGER